MPGPKVTKIEPCSEPAEDSRFAILHTADPEQPEIRVRFYARFEDGYALVMLETMLDNDPFVIYALVKVGELMNLQVPRRPTASKETKP